MRWRLKKEINKQKQKQLSEIAKHSSEIVNQLKTSINLMRRILQETEVKRVKKGNQSEATQGCFFPSIFAFLRRAQSAV